MDYCFSQGYQCEVKHKVSSTIWTWVADFLSYRDNRYVRRAWSEISLVSLKFFKLLEYILLVSIQEEKRKTIEEKNLPSLNSYIK